VAVFDGVDDRLEMLYSARNFFKNELVFNGEAVNKYVADGECLKHPILGGVVAECLGIADEVLMSVVTSYADTENIFDGLSQTIKGGSG
jgi:hypothetical protein